MHHIGTCIPFAFRHPPYAHCTKTRAPLRIFSQPELCILKRFHAATSFTWDPQKFGICGHLPYPPSLSANQWGSTLLWLHSVRTSINGSLHMAPPVTINGFMREMHVYGRKFFINLLWIRRTADGGASEGDFVGETEARAVSSSSVKEAATASVVPVPALHVQEGRGSFLWMEKNHRIQKFIELKSRSWQTCLTPLPYVSEDVTEEADQDARRHAVKKRGEYSTLHWQYIELSFTKRSMPTIYYSTHLMATCSGVDNPGWMGSSRWAWATRADNSSSSKNISCHM